jgi:hypothetical protein
MYLKLLHLLIFRVILKQSHPLLFAESSVHDQQSANHDLNFAIGFNQHLLQYFTLDWVTRFSPNLSAQSVQNFSSYALTFTLAIAKAIAVIIVIGNE